ncbi:hypothetical protein Y032_0004g1771 [Ancylostoma ceylanicum]|uniref:SCP domain-containing protein n=1 Tax=Ancylostoma ceylanicum TaxID=53326 RepID=A0A016VT66_9BILA|nr:hypothetical protein Y032_0004g1771 [Ancylostoma ceylanicum]
MTDALRNLYLRLHNSKRSLLATGQVPRKNGKTLPTASDMRKMTYDCELEKEAIHWASQCPTTHSQQSTRPKIGENFKTFSAAGHPSFEEAAENSINEWWKVMSTVNYFPTVVYFRRLHVGKPITSFTQMAWSRSYKLGCSIVKCTTSQRYVSVCRYSPRGNYATSKIYNNGGVCTDCPSGATNCNPSEGLCF